MNLRLGVTPDDQAVADAVARFADTVLAPCAQEIDAQELSTTCHVPQLAELGVMGMNLPEHLGGAGVTPTAMLLSLVEISRACAATSSMIGAHYLGTDALLIGGSAEQHQRYLPRAASGATRHGTPVGSGRARGRACRLDRPDQGERLARGDVLVVATTDPAWTPLFLKAGALVMETGGFMSHGAIVAREFGIPIRYAGIGERPEDLRVFDAEAFVDALLPGELGG